MSASPVCRMSVPEESKNKRVSRQYESNLDGSINKTSSGDRNLTAAANVGGRA